MESQKKKPFGGRPASGPTPEVSQKQSLARLTFRSLPLHLALSDTHAYTYQTLSGRRKNKGEEGWKAKSFHVLVGSSFAILWRTVNAPLQLVPAVEGMHKIAVDIKKSIMHTRKRLMRSCTAGECLNEFYGILGKPSPTLRMRIIMKHSKDSVM
ncbi:unnamed protein product [Phytomonas sp. EM1]|nr:unnamed protein product [Phytomonas sp. EM1]|eukprot:CCW60280.1 unnamed protein product [Phytomonas sp. isolate EM1]